MEHLGTDSQSAESVITGLISVFGITDKGMAQRGQMGAYLMGFSRKQLHLSVGILRIKGKGTAARHDMGLSLIHI